MNDQMRPRPEVGSQRLSSERQWGHIGRGGMRFSPHAAHTSTNNSPRAHPSQNGALVVSRRSGSSQVVSIAITDHP